MYHSGSFASLRSDDSDYVWRYMDFTKFISLLDSKSLFFSRADRFIDPFEGATPIKNIGLREQRLKAYLPVYPLPDKDEYEQRMKMHFKNKMHLRKRVAINCWHQNNHESEAMWKLYVPSGEGVAIRTTVGKLKSSLEKSKEYVEISSVNYIDYESDSIEESSILAPFRTKRKSFEHEREIRALIFRGGGEGNNLNSHIELINPTINSGITVPVSLDNLIQDIYISPTASDWFKQLVLNVMKKYTYDFKVSQSMLTNKPYY
ncbi:DUF2971 domain-containing protein [Agarivorans albus]